MNTCMGYCGQKVENCVADNSNSTEVIYLPPLSLVSCKRTTFNCHTLLL